MTQTDITMSIFQLRRFEVLSQLNGGQINGREAGEKLGLSRRHIRRLKKRVREKGVQGLTHANRGRKSGRSVVDQTKARIKKLLTSTYRGFGPTLAGEKLAERDRIIVSHEWLRLFMIKQALWTARKRGHRVVHRAWRPRLELAGALEQFDGSYHYWLPGQELCLLLAIDDARGIITQARFAFDEGLDAVFLSQVNDLFAFFFNTTDQRPLLFESD